MMAGVWFRGKFSDMLSIRRCLENEMFHLSTRDLSKEARAAIEKLDQFFMSQPAFLIAFSGGMDSSFLALAASRYKPDAYRAVLVNSPFMSAEETQTARLTATRYGLKYEEVKVDPLLCDNVVRNDPQRCYHCKKMIFSGLLELLQPGETICEGSVTDDDNDHRPGKVAINELNVRSPLRESGFSKIIIAEILRANDAGEIVRPGQSCLATRIATGSQITSDKLLQIATGEAMLRLAGLKFCRLRHHGNLARIEVDAAELHRALDVISTLTEQLKSIGFKHICIDISGYRRGSMNE